MRISPDLGDARLQQVLDAARAGHWDWRPEVDELRVDDRLAGWLGTRPTRMTAYRALTRDRQSQDGAEWYRVGWRWIEERSLTTPDGHVVAACFDVTDRRRRERALAWEAEHDPLTGLLSRRCFDRLLERAVAAPRLTVSLLMVDVDGFKAVNDRLGHAAGDQVLAALAHRLRGVVRRSDPVARWGGDEFAVILEGNASGLRAGGVAHRLLVASRRPAELATGAVPVRASVGVAVLRPGEDAPSLAARADHALYAAKRAGGDRWCLEGWSP